MAFPGRGVAVCDSKNSHGAALVFETDAWASFVTRAKELSLTLSRQSAKRSSHDGTELSGASTTPESCRQGPAFGSWRRACKDTAPARSASRCIQHAILASFEQLIALM
ncbi:DUF397 domain-containing protein [Streptomyces roseoverticillatus]|nr:DUF397 domain-containing protein [Streptomyces roseoverticillatus]